MNENLPILAIETTGELCSVALILDENTFVESNFLQKHIHSKKIISMIDSVLSIGELRTKDLKSIALSCGPGSFTGLRIGFSATKAIAFGLDIGIVHVPTFNAYAFQFAKQLPENTKFIIANRASMDQIYVGKYISKSNSYEIEKEIESINKNLFQEYTGAIKFVYGNVNNRRDYLNASSVGLWAYFFGNDLLTFDYDYTEPEYFGNPFLKKKKQ